MELKKVAKIGDLGYTSMLSGYLENMLIVYGGSNFPKGTPPTGKRYVYNDIYLLDENFEIVSVTKGQIYPDRSIIIQCEKEIYLISGANNTKIFKYTLLNKKVIEEEIFDIKMEIIGGFGCFFDNKLYFGKEKIYEYDILEKKLTEKKDFLGKVREQSVYFSKDENLFILSGASEIGHLDAYRYDILKNEMYKLNDVPKCFGGATGKMIDDDNAIIIGGFNKEIYDEAVLKLSDINFKIDYFSKKREDFNWNKKIYRYNLKEDSYEVIGENLEFAKCGAGLLIKGNKIYIVNGEYKPGYRDPNIYEGEIK